MRVRKNVIDELEDAWLGLTNADIKAIQHNNPFKPKPEDEGNNGIAPLRLMKDTNYVMYAAKTLLNLELLPIQAAIIHELWTRPFPMFIGSRGLSKTSSMAFYFLLKMALTPRNKAGGPGVQIIITGAGFRQAKQVFEYMEGCLGNSKILRSICDDDLKRCIVRESDRYSVRIGPNIAHCIPLGDGSKVRGLRGNIVCSDEFNSINPEIFETVIQGFAAVSSNPVDKVKQRAKEKRAEELNVPIPIGRISQNQIIISGTCGYDFEHFADYWRKYKTIIESQGDAEKMSDIFPDGIPNRFDWKDYSIIRIPYSKIPEGFLDENILTRAKATLHSGTFACEFGAVFSKDSAGFFKRSLIDSCVASEKHLDSPYWPKAWCPTPFDAAVRGDPNKEYLIAIDPASEVDNFSIIVLELWAEHRRIVYCWTTNKKQHRAAIQAGVTQENDFYAYCARTIRNLMAVFPCKRIAIDGQGGGIGVIEALHNKNNIRPEYHEKPIWPIIDMEKPAPTDHEPGEHIIEVCQFASAEWTQEANNALRKDMEDKTLLFPRFDSVSLELASGFDRARQAELEIKNPGMEIRIYNTIEDCVLEIEELKDELTSIIHTRVGTGVNMRDRWDTPEVKGKTGKKGRLRKDRYSALLMANITAKRMQTTRTVIQSGAMGGVLMDAKGTNANYCDYAPDSYKSQMKDFWDEL